VANFSILKNGRYSEHGIDSCVLGTAFFCVCAVRYSLTKGECRILVSQKGHALITRPVCLTRMGFLFGTGISGAFRLTAVERKESAACYEMKVETPKQTLTLWSPLNGMLKRHNSHGEMRG